jgi:hypothetical protein
MAEAKKTTARRPRATTRTKKLVAEEVSAPQVTSAPIIAASAPASIIAASAPAPIIAASAPAPIIVDSPAPLGEWVPIIYDGATVFADADAGVFVAGTRTRLKARVAARLLRVEGFRLAA